MEVEQAALVYSSCCHEERSVAWCTPAMCAVPGSYSRPLRSDERPGTEEGEAHGEAVAGQGAENIGNETAIPGIDTGPWGDNMPGAVSSPRHRYYAAAEASILAPARGLEIFDAIRCYL